MLYVVSVPVLVFDGDCTPGREALIEAYDPNEDEDDADLDDVAELEMADNGRLFAYFW